MRNRKRLTQRVNAGIVTIPTNGKGFGEDDR